MLFNRLRVLTLTLGILTTSFSILLADDLDESPIGLQLGYRLDSITIERRPHTKLLDDVDKQAWKNIPTFTMGINGATYTEYNVFIKGKAVAGQSYRSSSRIDVPNFPEGSRRHTGFARGNTYEFEFGIGFPVWFKFCYDWLHFIPLLGFEYTRLKLRGREQFHTLGSFLMSHRDRHSSSTHHSTDAIHTRSHNRATLEAPWIGLDFVAYLCQWRISGGYEYLFGYLKSGCEYTAEDHFSYNVSDRAHGHGNSLHLDVGYKFTTEWEADLLLNYRDWSAHKGQQKTKFVRPSPAPTLRRHSKVKTIHWETWECAFSLIARY